MTELKLVPMEPTLDMLCEGTDVYGSEDCAETDVLGIYKAMLAAAPDVQGEPVGWQFYQDGKWRHGDDRIKDHRKNTEEAGIPVRDVYASPQPSEQQGGGGLENYTREPVHRNSVSDRPELVAVALAVCDAVDDLIEKWYATRESGCLPNQVVRAMGASKLLRLMLQEDIQSEMDECFCDTKGIGERGISCGDCPRDYTSHLTKPPQLSPNVSALVEALEDIRSRSSMNLAMNPNPFELTAMLGDIHQIAGAALAEESSND